MKMKHVTLIIVVVIMAFAWAYVDSDIEDAESSQSHYCDMVERFRQSGGQYGWRDYEQSYDEWCL